MMTGTVPLAVAGLTELTDAAAVGSVSASTGPAETAASVSAAHAPADTSAPEVTLLLPRI
jgi:hypothetical protein